MEVNAKKATDPELVRWACGLTSGRDSSATLEAMYHCEHSPVRTQWFAVELIDIPYSVSVHFVRHHIGVTHFVRTSRPDLGGDPGNRYPNVNHGLLINAQELINVARKRRCKKAEAGTRAVMEALVVAIAEIDHALACYLVPECVYRGGWCHELKGCGMFPQAARRKSVFRFVEGEVRP